MENINQKNSGKKVVFKSQRIENHPINSLNKILKQELELIKVDNRKLKEIKQIADDFCSKLKNKLKTKKIDAQVFIGGSLAKKTLINKNIQDIDIFVRFSNKYDSNKISDLLQKVLNKDARRIHGSRDYYQIKINEIILEIIPVIKVNKPNHAINITDLSYFHVNYILKKFKTNKQLGDEIIIAKTFAHACDCYGAESYINGFSGYALELLICHYGSFLKFIKAIVKIKDGEKVIIDDAGLYKNKGEILISLNKSKLESPIILIDPTFKERNALAGLNKETFLKFKKYCFNFLNTPRHEFFKKHSISEEFKSIPNTKIIKIKTSKQPGDIAGTKSKKFFRFFTSKVEEEFEIKKKGFEYDDENNIANFYFVLDKKKEEEIKGPEIINIENLKRFKKTHHDAFIKKGSAYIKLKHDLDFDYWFKKFLKDNKKIIREMCVKSIKLEK